MDMGDLDIRPDLPDDELLQAWHCLLTPTHCIRHGDLRCLLRLVTDTSNQPHVLLDNPLHDPFQSENLGNPRIVKVVVNVRESAISSLAARGVLSPHQAAAARRFEKLWLAFVGPRLKSPAYELSATQLFSRDGLSEKQAEAASELRIVRSLIGGCGLRSEECADFYSHPGAHLRMEQSGFRPDQRPTEAPRRDGSSSLQTWSRSWRG